MSARRPCPPAPGPLEDYAQRFDALFSSLAQRRGFRDYLQGLLLPRDRNKTLTGLAGAEPIAGAQHREVQRLQWFLSESSWAHQVVNDRRVRLLREDAATAPHDGGVLVLDDTGDRKDGTATAHVARQYLGSVGKIDNGIVAVTSLWADARRYWPVHAVPYTPASRLPGGEQNPGFRTKPQLAVELVKAAQQASVPFRAVVADCAYGDNLGFTDALVAAMVPFVLALKPRRGTWAPAEAAHTPTEAAGELGWQGSSKPGRWRRVTRRFRDGHTETWWAADAELGGWGPDRRLRLVVASTDPARLPGHSSWYLLTNLPRPATRRAQQANLAEIVRLYGLRNWVEQSYKQVKGELGWADFQVRSDRAIRRHWALVCCAFSFCWQTFLAEHPTRPALPDQQAAPAAARGATPTGHRRRTRPQELVAGGVAGGQGLADPMDRVAALLAVVVASRAAPAAATAA
jgi:DDE superfamily endonuclease